MNSKPLPGEDMFVTHHEIPASHPRRLSLETRSKIVAGLDRNVVATAGLIAHGRGEAFDYILGETTLPPAKKAIEAAAALIFLATRPVISVNGNVAALCAPEIAELSRVSGAALEINLFYRSPERERAIKAHLKAHGAAKVLGTGDRASARIPGLQSSRGQVDPEGIFSADAVFLALEDGDRTEQLVRMNKKVIAVDLNPFSRTAQYADVTIVDNVVRALPLLTEKIRELKKLNNPSIAQKRLKSYDNARVLSEMITAINKRLKRFSRKGIFLKIGE